MAGKIRMSDIKLRYLGIAEARQRSGLRLVLGAYPVPGPWREACKGIFHVKNVPYLPVATANEGRLDSEFGMNGGASELLDWTGQESAPVAVWNDEKPCSTWIDQLNLAERIAPAPQLIPDGVEDRALMFGLANELCGTNGLGWTKRLAMIHDNLTALAADHPGRAFWVHMGNKYGYTAPSGEAAPARMARIVGALGCQLERQYDAGRTFFVGERLSAIDIYWSTFVAMLAPLDETLCPMATSIRATYTNPDPEVQLALSPLLLRHRDFIYRNYLELPIRF